MACPLLAVALAGDLAEARLGLVEAGEDGADVAIAAHRGRAEVGDVARLGVLGRGDGRAEGVEPGDDVRAAAGPCGHVERDAVLDEVPVGLEVLDHPAQGLRPAERRPVEQLDELGGGQAGRWLAVGVVEQLVEEVLPAFVEGQLALQLVEDVEPRGQPGLDGELEQDAPGEGVQRADRRLVERLEGAGAPSRRRRRAELGADAVAQLGGRLLGERDRGDGVDRDALVDEGEDARHQRRGLAGTGAGLDEQGGVGPRADAITGVLVGRRPVVVAVLVEQRQLLSHRRRAPRRAGTNRPGRGRRACAPMPPTPGRCRGRRDRRTSTTRTGPSPAHRGRRGTPPTRFRSPRVARSMATRTSTSSSTRRSWWSNFGRK